MAGQNSSMEFDNENTVILIDDSIPNTVVEEPEVKKSIIPQKNKSEMILKDNIKRMKEGSDYEAETTVDLLLDSANTIENKAQEELTRYNDPRLNKYIHGNTFQFLDSSSNKYRYSC